MQGIPNISGDWRATNDGNKIRRFEQHGPLLKVTYQEGKSNMAKSFQMGKS
jgi:hypothetical protein